MRAGAYAMAVWHYTMSLELDARNAASRNDRAQAFLQARNFRGALVDAMLVLADDPYNIKVSPQHLN
jgi:hypothetical protein